MTTPNEPVRPGPADSSLNPGSSPDSAGQRPGTPAATVRVTETGEPPPWQRGTTAPPHSAPPRPSGAAEPPGKPGPPVQQPRPAGHSAGVDARLSRFVSGTAAPGAQTTQVKPVPVRPDPGRGESPHADGYGSELPDLSAPSSRPPQGKPAAEPGDGPGPAGSSGSTWVAERRVQVSARPRGPVRASMQIRRIDPWSALKVSLLLSVALFFVWMIAVALLYLVLGSMGVWSKLNSNVGDLLTNTGGAGTGELVSSGSIFGGSVLIGLVNIVLLTAMATLGAVVYNLSTDVIGGIEVTLADRD